MQEDSSTLRPSVPPSVPSSVPPSVPPSLQELQAIVAQRGQELVRMNAAASHLALAHSIWGQVLRPGGIAVDATCGNGHDALAIAKFLFPTGVSRGLYGRLHCIDIQ
ncbi:hypothetical protein VYU27_010706, partial [Nannochloropsis oceanica]